MLRFLGCGLILCLSGTVAYGFSGQDRDDHRDGDDHGEYVRHDDWARHHPEDRDEHRDWNYEHDRIESGHHFPHGRFDSDRRAFLTASFDYRSRRVILDDHSAWVVASYDRDRCRDWRWGRDKVLLFEDDVHPGWYVLFNERVGGYVHVEFFGR